MSIPEETLQVRDDIRGLFDRLKRGLPNKIENVPTSRSYKDILSAWQKNWTHEEKQTVAEWAKEVGVIKFVKLLEQYF